jgi:hypothetical protein
MGISESGRQLIDSDATNGRIETDYSENVNAAFDFAMSNLRWSADKFVYNDEFDKLWDENNAKIVAAGGQALTRKELWEARSDLDETGGMFGGQKVIDAHRSAIGKLKEKDGGILDLYEMESEAKNRAKATALKDRATYNDVSSRAGFGGSVGGFVGMGAGSMLDPINIGVTLAAAPLALEGWGAAILGNAAINTAAESGIQFLPGGTRDWARELGVSEDEINRDSVMAIGGAAVFGGAIGGGIKGLGAGGKWVGRKLFGTPQEARAAAQSLQGANLSPEQKEALDVILRAQSVEDAAAFDVLHTKFGSVDGQQMMKNLQDFQEVSRAVADLSYDPKARAITPEDIAVIDRRLGDIDTVIREIETGNIAPDELDSFVRTFTTEERYQRFNELVDDYKAAQSPNRLSTLAETERRLEGMQAQKADAINALDEAKVQLERMKEIQAKKAKDFDDASAILSDYDAQIKGLERDVLAVHEGHYGMLPQEAVDDIHRSLMEQITALKNERATFAKEAKGIERDLAEFNKKVEKAERRASKDPAEKISEIERDTLNDIEIARDEANFANQAERNAALEVLREMRLIDENKKLYAELFASNPRVSVERMREIVGLQEMRNRLADGEELTAKDFLDILTDEKAQKLDELFDKHGTLLEAVDDFLKREKTGISKEGRKHIDAVATRVNEILASLDESLTIKDVADTVQRVMNNPPPSPKQVAEAVKTFVDGLGTPKSVAELNGILESNLNMSVYHGVDADGKPIVKTVDEIKKEIEAEEMLAEVLEACKVG